MQREGDSGYVIDFSVDLEQILSDFAIPPESVMAKEKATVEHQLVLWQNQAHMGIGAGQGTAAQLDFAKELSPQGLLSRYYARLQKGQPIDLRNVLRELLVQEVMVQVIQLFSTEHDLNAKIQNYDGSYVMLRVSKCSMTFGEIYAFMEEVKQRLPLQTYSCKLASLEEVFNAHATD